MADRPLSLDDFLLRFINEHREVCGWHKLDDVSAMYAEYRDDMQRRWLMWKRRQVLASFPHL